MRQLLVRLGVVGAAVLLGASACGSQRAPTSSSTPTSAATPVGTPTGPPAVHWSYEGDTGPQHWGSLEADYEACGLGKKQSPIDIAKPTQADLKNVEFHYSPSALNIVNNGHTVQVNYDPGSYIVLDGTRYDVTQFHYHAPSEHEVDGKGFPAELHIVHADSQKNLAVVGLLLQSGAENEALAPFIDNLPPTQSEERDAGVQIDIKGLIPADQTTYRYDGSLTTPPCSEGVEWVVMTTPVSLSADQLSALGDVYDANNRPVQALNGRTVDEDSTP